jgi:hypothetical protein
MFRYQPIVELLGKTKFFIFILIKNISLHSWYERAREKAWKKYGGRFQSTSQTKRIYPKKGLLGYKVLIDGFNNTFEVPIEQFHGAPSASTTRSEQDSRYAGFSEEERDKLIRMKSFVKEFALDDRKRAKQIAAANLQQSRRPPLLIHQTSDPNKHSIQPSDSIVSLTEVSSSQNRSNIIIPDLKTFRKMFDIDNSSVTNLSSSTTVSAPTFIKRMEGQSYKGVHIPCFNLNYLLRFIFTLDNHNTNDKPKRVSKTANKPLISLRSPTATENEKHTLPKIISAASNTPTRYSSLTNKLDTVVTANKASLQPLMSSIDAYTLSSSLIASNIEQRKLAKRRELFTQIKQSLEEHESEKSTNPLSGSVPITHKTVHDNDVYIPLPDHPTNRRSSPIKSRLDADIRQATVGPYERYASATTRSTAVQCLQEAGYFKGKSWLKQVEISKEMVKHQVKRRIRRSDGETNHKPIVLPLRANVSTTSAVTHRPNAVKVN